MTQRLILKMQQAGFTLVKFMIALSVLALLAFGTIHHFASQSDKILAQKSGSYLAAVANASKWHVAKNYYQYSRNLPVTGVANHLQPTVAELVALGHVNPGFSPGTNTGVVSAYDIPLTDLNPGFPLGALPTGQSVKINITPSGCPGVGCQITALVCTATPVTLGGDDTRFDLAAAMVEAQNGSGGQSLHGAGATIRGPILNVPNPFGNVEGIVCSASTLDSAPFLRFIHSKDLESFTVR